MREADKLRELAASPAAFRNNLLVDCDGGPQRLGDVLDDWQAQDFTSLDSGWRQVATGQRIAGAFQRAWLERPRGHSKTADIATMTAWALFASRRQLSGVAAAADLDQARLLRDAIAKLTSLNPWLAKVLDVQNAKVVNKHTGSALAIITADVASSWGHTPSFVICDEIVHWSGRGLFDSLFSAAAKRESLFLTITNSGFSPSWCWDLREAVRVDPEWYFSRLDGAQASWITPDRLAEQRRLLPDIAYRRLWKNEWTSGSGDALEPAYIDHACQLTGPATRPETGWAYAAGLDIGLSRDASALVILGRHVGHVQHVPAPKRPRLTAAQLAMRDLGLLDEDHLILEQSPGVRYIQGTGRLKLVSLRCLAIFGQCCGLFWGGD